MTSNSAMQLAHHPYSIFLIDGIGAVIYALVLMLVLVPLEDFFGMPRNIVLLLAAPACVFAVYSLSCYFIRPKNYRSFLAAIIIANLIYCAVSLALAIYHWQQLTRYGAAYFLGEVLVIALLVRLEFLVWQAIGIESRN